MRAKGWMGHKSSIDCVSFDGTVSETKSRSPSCVEDRKSVLYHDKASVDTSAACSYCFRIPRTFATVGTHLQEGENRGCDRFVTGKQPYFVKDNFEAAIICNAAHKFSSASRNESDYPNHLFHDKLVSPFCFQIVLDSVSSLPFYQVS